MYTNFLWRSYFSKLLWVDWKNNEYNKLPLLFYIIWYKELCECCIRTLHEREQRKGLSRMQFFTISAIISFAYYVLPGYLFTILSFFSWICWISPDSVTANQIGSGLHGLGIGAVTLDWAGVSSYLGSPLVTPWFSIVNIGIGFFLFIYVFIPLSYWKFDIYNAKRFPIFSSQLFTDAGQKYNTTRILTPEFGLNIDAYNNYSKLYLSTFFAFSTGFGFARIAATLTHVILFNGKWVCLQPFLCFPILCHFINIISRNCITLILVCQLRGLSNDIYYIYQNTVHALYTIYSFSHCHALYTIYSFFHCHALWFLLHLFAFTLEFVGFIQWHGLTKINLPTLFMCSEILKQSRSSINTNKPDIHARLMKNYNDVPQWWFLILLVGSMALSLILSIIWKDDIQLPWWGMLLACGLACILSLPIGVVQATTNQVKNFPFLSC